jgi:hypothetical protein
MALMATLHCLTGCAIGEVAGMIIGTALNWSNFLTIVISIILAFIFGFSLSMRPLLKGGLSLQQALPVVLAADTLSITVMEIFDNLTVLVIPGAMDASLASWLFWSALALSMGVAFTAAYPVNRYLLTKNKGHALTMQYHSSYGDEHVHHDD